MSESAAGLVGGRPAGVALGSLLATDSAQRVTGVSLDSRRVHPGDLYVALPGARAHGAEFAGAAVAAGAVAMLTDAAGAQLAGVLGVPVVVVADPRREAARVAAEVYGRPSDHLLMFGVTGTAGKTSTTFLLEAGLAAAGQVVGTIGTVGFRLAGKPVPGTRTTVTTPESPDLQALLAQMRGSGATAVAMEVSSHALALHRVEWITFDVAGFTNLGSDHLDFHADQESYFAAKADLFLSGRAKHAVVNTDDQWGERLADLVRRDGHAVLHTTGMRSGADYRVLDWSTDSEGRSRVRLATPQKDYTFEVGMIGEFNVRNALTAAAMIDVSPVPLGVALPGLAQASVPGRMQRVELGAGAPNVVVDFAHTPEAVAAALNALPPGRRIAVLGCGGDRDQAKRGPMGAAAARDAQVVVVTDDNPRSEEPAIIRAAVLAGARAEAARSGAEVIDGAERRGAIALALRRAHAGDWVAILGKGHETGQDIAGVITPFDDVSVAGEEWLAINSAGGLDA